MRHKGVKNTNFSSPREFFQAHNAPNPVFGRGSVLDPAGEDYDTLPDPLVGWKGKGNPLPIPLHLASRSPRLRRLTSHLLWIPVS